MSTSDSWPKLEAEFTELSKSAGDLHANAFGPAWHLTGAPGEKDARAKLHDQFDSLARLAGVKAGVPNRANARDGWLNLVREECPHFTIFKGSMITSVCLASAETCKKLEHREIELEKIAASSGPFGFRRDMYQPMGWLYDHDHQLLREPDAELGYWKKYIWESFHECIDDIKKISENRQRQGDPPWGDRGNELQVAIVKLSYDLAVLQANHSLDMGLRGDDALGAFGREEVSIAQEIGSARLAARQALELPLVGRKPIDVEASCCRVSSRCGSIS